MKILVTGSEGFIGKNMVAFLSLQEEWQIDTWDWDPCRESWPDVKNYDWVIHLGAVTAPSDTDVEKIMRQNYDFSCWLFEQCNYNGVHLQYASTSDVYGKTRDFSEYAACHPETPYAWSKYLFDRWVFQQEHHVYVQGFRYFDVYGKWMHLKGENASYIYQCRQQARKQGYIEVWEGAETAKRDWVWVGDICQLHLDFMLTVRGSGLWNAGSGLAHSFLDIAEEIAEQEGVELRYLPVPADLKIKSTCADLKHLKETVGKRKWLNVYEWIDLGD